MAKVKMTKGELRRQRESLKQFRHYLPTLQLKKQQLQMEVNEKRRLLRDKQQELKTRREELSRWVGLLADPRFFGLLEISVSGEEKETQEALNRIKEALKKWILPEDIDVETGNIAGAEIPKLKNIRFPELKYNYFEAPLWVDRGMERLQEFMSFLVELDIAERQLNRLSEELRTTTQRVNLFEKVKIPECQENIRRIRIYLGDQQANMVGISKVAKGKIEQVAV